jgi:glycosyltransferase involved in cell wall biosynthesis
VVIALEQHNQKMDAGAHGEAARGQRLAPVNWLILSHAFNMDGRAASQTMTDKIPHLIAEGINPIVLSAVTGRRDRIVEHHRLLPVSPAGLRFDLRHVLRRHISNRVIYNIAVLLMTLPLLPFYALERLLLPLEPQTSWLVSAYVWGARLIRSRRCTVIYSAGGAKSAHHAAYLLARKFSLPWIAEIHESMVPPDRPASGRRERYAAWLEGVICRHADVAIWAVETALDNARRRHPQLGERGKLMIPGADRPPFGKIGHVRGAELVIGYFGSLAAERNLSVFLDALAALLRKRPELAEIVRLELYGGSIDPVSAQAIARFPFPQVVRNFGRLENDPLTGESGRDRVLKRMQTVDALLLLHGPDAHCGEYIPSKFYEYLWTQRPIIGLLAPNAHLERMFREEGHWALPADDASAVAACLEALVARWQADDLPDSGKPSAYTVQAAVTQIVAWADEACRGKGRNQACRTS